MKTEEALERDAVQSASEGASGSPPERHPLTWILFWAAFAAGLALRLADLGARPLHHDEGINAWRIWKAVRGEPLRYDPTNFHGPLPFELGRALMPLLGTGDAALRLPVALLSALMILLLLPLRRRLGPAGTACAAWLLALSPSLVYYGRDLIHETFLAFFTLALLACGSLYAETRHARWLALAEACLGALPAIKETFVLTLAALAAAGLLAFWRTRPAGSGRLPSLPGWIRPRHLALAAAMAAGVSILFFTSFLTHPEGLLDALEGPLLWTRRGVAGEGHEKPWYYFLHLLLHFEPAIALGALAGGWLAWRRRDLFGILCAAWAAAQLATYSSIPYKTPWLVLNVLVPAALAAGIAGRELAARTARSPLGDPETSREPAPRELRSPYPAPRSALLIATVLLLAWTAWRAADTAFVRYDDDRLAIVYVPTLREVRGLLARIHHAATRPPGASPARVRLFLAYPWPVAWYLRGLPGLGVWKQVTDQPDGDVLLVEGDQEKKLRNRLRNRYLRREYHLRPRVPVVLYIKSPTG